jgi:DNA-binding GntR family transcriptional regulator
VQEHREISEMIRAENTTAAVEALRKGFDDAVVRLRRQLAADSEDEQTG